MNERFIRNSGTWQVDSAKLFALLSTHLYPHRLAFLRELVANAVDATLLRNDSKHHTVEVRVRHDRIEIEDWGRGLSPADLGVTLGRVGVSGTQALVARLTSASADLPPPSGIFGVGLLACWHVATLVSIRSWAGGDEPAIDWRWQGGPHYSWSTTVPPTRAGTLLTIHLDDAYSGAFSREQVIDYLSAEMPFVPVSVVVDGERTSDPTPPWRHSQAAPRAAPKAALRWASKRGLHGVLAAACVPLGRLKSRGVLALLPDAGTTWSQQVDLYRGGIRVRQLPQLALVPSSLSWLKLVIDAPGIPVALDRESLTERGGKELRDELGRALLVALDELLDALMDRRASQTWLQAHRAGLLEAIGWRIECVPTMRAERRQRLARWLPFRTQHGWATLSQIFARRSRRVYGVQRRFHDLRWLEHNRDDELAIGWSGLMDETVCLWLAEELGHPITRWTRGERAPPTVTPIDYPTSVETLCRVLHATLATKGIDVHVDPSFTTRSLAVRWIRPPKDEDSDSPVFGLDQLATLGCLAPLVQPSLAINPWSSVIQHLSTEVDENNGAPLAWLLVEYASTALRASASASARDLQRRLLSAMFALTRGRVPLSQPLRCYVAYDWTRQRREFAVIKQVFGGAPYNWEVMDASTYQSGQYFLDNILNAMDSAHIFVSVLEQARGQSRLNYNVLMEAGIASSYRGRPHLVCLRQTLAEISNLDGFIGVTYDTLDDLPVRLDQVARSRELHHLTRESEGTGRGS